MVPADMTVAKWRDLLSTAYGDGKWSGSRICETQDSQGAKIFQVLTKEALATYGHVYRALPLEKVIAISRQLTDTEIVKRLTGERPEPGKELEKFVAEREWSGRELAAVAVKPIDAKIAELEPLIEIATIVNDMHAHAKGKHTPEKTAGIWARIKSYLWFWSVNSRITPQVKAIKTDADASLAQLGSVVFRFFRDKWLAQSAKASKAAAQVVERGTKEYYNKNARVQRYEAQARTFYELLDQYRPALSTSSQAAV